MSDYDDIFTASTSADSKRAPQQPATKRSGQHSGKPTIPGAVKGKPSYEGLPTDRKQQIDDAIAEEHARKGPKGLKAKIAAKEVRGEGTLVRLALGADHGVRLRMKGYLQGTDPNGNVWTTPPESIVITELDGLTCVAIAKVPIALHRARKLEWAILNP